MGFVHTAFGPGKIVAEDKIGAHGRQYKVEGPGFSIWMDAAKIAASTVDEGGPGHHVDNGNSVNLPYNPTPQHDWNDGDDTTTIQPDEAGDVQERKDFALNRTHPSNSITLNDVSDDESYDKVEEHNFVGKGYRAEYPAESKSAAKHFVRPAGLDPKYAFPADVIDYSSPIWQWRNDPSGYIDRQASLRTAALDDHVGNYQMLILGDEQLRTAAWDEIRAKALRLRREGHVKVNDQADNRIHASVGPYTVMIVREGTKIANWSCECQWGRWAHKRGFTFQPRLCAHGLAAFQELQSSGIPKQADAMPRMDWPSAMHAGEIQDYLARGIEPWDYEALEALEGQLGPRPELQHLGKELKTEPTRLSPELHFIDDTHEHQMVDLDGDKVVGNQKTADLARGGTGVDKDPDDTDTLGAGSMPASPFIPGAPRIPGTNVNTPNYNSTLPGGAGNADPTGTAGMPGKGATEVDKSGGSDNLTSNPGGPAPKPSASGDETGGVGNSAGADTNLGGGIGQSAGNPIDGTQMGNSYTVQSGDTLSDIAQNSGYGDNWQALYDQNKGTVGDNPDLIMPGQQLNISGPGGGESSSSGSWFGGGSGSSSSSSSGGSGNGGFSNGLGNSAPDGTGSFADAFGASGGVGSSAGNSMDTSVGVGGAAGSPGISSTPSGGVGQSAGGGSSSADSSAPGWFNTSAHRFMFADWDRLAAPEDELHQGTGAPPGPGTTPADPATAATPAAPDAAAGPAAPAPAQPTAPAAADPLDAGSGSQPAEQSTGGGGVDFMQMAQPFLDAGATALGDIGSSIGGSLADGLGSAIGNMFSASRHVAYPEPGDHQAFNGSGPVDDLEFHSTDEKGDEAEGLQKDIDVTKMHEQDGGKITVGSINGRATFGDADLAASAARFLRTAGRVYSAQEQAELEGESHPQGARNLASLDLEGTHYLP